MTAEQAHHTPGQTGLPEPQLGDDMHPLLRKLMDNIKTISIVAIAFLVVFGGYALYDYVQTKRLTSSGEMLGEILVSTSGEERVQALRDFAASAPAALQTSALMELAAALKEQEQHDQALAVWNELEGQVDPPLVPVVTLGKAKALEDAGKQQEALELLEGYKATAPESYKATLDRRLAELAEELGDLQKALSAYRELAKDENIGPSVKEYLLFKIGQLEEKVAG